MRQRRGVNKLRKNKKKKKKKREKKNKKGNNRGIKFCYKMSKDKKKELKIF